MISYNKPHQRDSNYTFLGNELPDYRPRISLNQKLEVQEKSLAQCKGELLTSSDSIMLSISVYTIELLEKYVYNLWAVKLDIHRNIVPGSCYIERLYIRRCWNCKYYIYIIECSQFLLQSEKT